MVEDIPIGIENGKTIIAAIVEAVPATVAINLETDVVQEAVIDDAVRNLLAIKQSTVQMIEVIF